jgi:hypothetical protein
MAILPVCGVLSGNVFATGQEGTHLCARFPRVWSNDQLISSPRA